MVLSGDDRKLVRDSVLARVKRIKEKRSIITPPKIEPEEGEVVEESAPGQE